jgi:hypothetical protein
MKPEAKETRGFLNSPTSSEESTNPARQYNDSSLNSQRNPTNQRTRPTMASAAEEYAMATGTRLAAGPPSPGGDGIHHLQREKAASSYTLSSINVRKGEKVRR